MADSTDDQRPAGKEPSDIRPISIAEEMKRSYLEYAMSVIISRALPDVRDGLKPVHRRILYAIQRLGLDWNKKHMKSSKVVGDTMGDFHPHGNLAIYDALVRMAQEFSLRVPLIDGQGNFGSIDGDPPSGRALHRGAALQDRAVSARRPRQGDGRLQGELRRPAAGAGRASRQVPQPAWSTERAASRSAWRPTSRRTILGEVIDACLAHLDNPEITIDELCQIIQGPDFPTGGLILGRSGILSAYHKGRGSILMRSKVEVEEIRKDREALIVSAIPYQVNKRTLIEKIADHVREKRIEGISDIWDEIQPRRHAHRHRTEARRGGRRRLEPALALLGSADELRRQHAGDQRRPA